MMFADASALTAILADEPGARQLLERMQSHPSRTTSPLVIWETALAVARLLGFSVAEAAEAVEQFLAEAKVEVREIPAEARFVALDAFARYGKGRHPAALNRGDCFAYACAKLAKTPLLYTGDDFAQTDIAAA